MQRPLTRAEMIHRQQGISHEHIAEDRLWNKETGNDKKSPPNGKETVYNENSIFSEEMNKWQCP
jgi:hypothetical protein